MNTLFPPIEVPRPKADKTGRRRRTGPLTLYVIEQNKQFQAQSARIDRLERENAQLTELLP